MKFTSLPGVISERALLEHVKLYDGYRDMLYRSDTRQISDPKPVKAELDHPYSSVVKSQSYAVSGYELHSLFFDNLSVNPSTPSEEFKLSIYDYFGSIDNLCSALIDTGLVSRGWVVLAKSINSGEMRIFSIDSHEIGCVFGYYPILVIDVWEHAYWMDWGSNKTGYINAIIKYVDWEVVSNRL